jgi:hypothetical protein
MPDLKLHSGTVKAGVLSAATYPAETLKNAKTGATMPDPRAGMHVATIAAALEYGAGQNHPRPFMQQTVAEKKKEWTSAAVKLMTAGESSAEALGTVGMIMKDDITDTIASWPADNSDQWAEFKGFNAGLRFTGHLLRSIDYEVEE